MREQTHFYVFYGDINSQSEAVGDKKLLLIDMRFYVKQIKYMS